MSAVVSQQAIVLERLRSKNKDLKHKNEKHYLKGSASAAYPSIWGKSGGVRLF
jgi:hypothetical protein